MSNQGASEFKAEIEVLSKLRHCHLVSLIGFCDDNKELILVYEYISRGTLYHHLHKDGTSLNWVQRLKIAIGAGRGLDYLHTGFGTQHGVIHRDVKSSNILLDENWSAMISDFGLSKIGPTNQSSSYVHVSCIKGTFGYLDPEYFYTRKLTRKTDVYAFGVVLFELLSGRLAVDERYGEEQCSLVRWAQKCVKERKLDQLVDSNMRGTVHPKCLRKFCKIADRCLLSVPKEGPTMTEVVASLQTLLILQEKYEDSAESSGTIGINSITHKYFGFSIKLNSDTTEKETPSRFSMSLKLGFSMSPKLVRFGSVHLTMSQVEKATNKFSPSLRIGEEGFGTSYKAQLENGQLVVIKRATKELSDSLRSDFRSELELYVNTDHQNLVKLLGYVEKGNDHLVITEYVPNGTLRQHLDGVHGSFLDFSQRLEICVDIACGLTYLHLYAKKQIIHGNVKTSNILLTKKMRAKVDDFGFETRGDPETDMRICHLTQKSDVYSFGVLLIEVLTGCCPAEGRRSGEEIVTLRWAIRKYKEGNVMDLVDPNMKEAMMVKSLHRCSV